MSNNFKIGQKVVCIENRLSVVLYQGEVNTEIGKVYTIRAIRWLTDLDKLGLLLQEIVNPVVDTLVGRTERFYLAENFRPVVEQKTDISAFRKLLLTKREDELIKDPVK
jgi:hypothetical protein